MYNDGMVKIVLPLSEESLHIAHKSLREVAMKAFEEQHFGRRHANKSVEKLQYEIDKVICAQNLLVVSEHLCCLLISLCRCIRITSWRMTINLQSCVRHYILDVRTIWTNFKFSDFRQWQSLMQGSTNATKVLKRNVLVHRRRAMNSG